MEKEPELDFSKLNRYSLFERPSKVKKEEFASLYKKGCSFNYFLNSLPDILAARTLKEVVKSVVISYNNKRPVVFAMGAHVIKCGLGPVVIDLIDRGVVKAIALNGAGIIHDFELSYIGSTSEDVAEELDTGRFGMAEETGRMLNEAVTEGANNNTGIGESIGRLIEGNSPYKEYSILAACYRNHIPATVHVAIGTDIIHMHPSADGKSIGHGSHLDFKKFCGVVSRLEGGVYFNIGSSVILPEVFLKAVSVVRNLGFTLEDFTTVNMDFIEKYRPLTNVVKRPTKIKGKGYSLIGHHEIMLPLIAAGVIEAIEEIK